MLIKAPAKINLTLRILSKRADGYHELSSLMRAIRLFDVLEVEAFTPWDRANGKKVVTFGAGEPYCDINVQADTKSVEEGPGNLAYKAASLMVSKLHGQIHGIDISIKKHIPVASGLGGGSADAAAVLLCLAKKTIPEIKLPDLADWGAEIGMDVPFCVYACAAANPDLGYEGAGTALAEGAGELITPLYVQEKAWLVLVNPQVEVPTKQVYELYDLRGGCDSASDNDLEASCAEAWPVVAETLSALKNICASEGLGDIKVQLSGSGPTIFAYFEESLKAEAERVYTRAKETFEGMKVLFTETL